MSLVTVAVDIARGELTPHKPHLLPEHGRGLLLVLPEAEGSAAFSIGVEADGLPVIRTEGGVITSAMVREIESFTL